MNTAGFDAYALGNHDFDAGLGRLQEQIDAADFPYLGANLGNLEGNLTGIAPYTVLDVAGVKVAMIGVTNPEAPTLVAPGNTGTIDITDPAGAAMQAQEAARRGATVFVAFATSASPASTPAIDEDHRNPFRRSVCRVSRPSSGQRPQPAPGSLRRARGPRRLRGRR
jgi:5'-nucleotidase